MTTPRHPNWTVLLLGGHSGTGKTTVSRVLAQQFGTALSQVDDFRLVMQRVTTPEQEPILHSLLPWEQTNALSPEEVCNRLIQIAEFMSRALEIVVAHHVATKTPIILEGDGITPAFAGQRQFANLEASAGQVRAVFVIASDENRLLTATRQRERGEFRNLPLSEQQRQVHINWLYGQWLQQQAEVYGIPVVATHPWNTLASRIRDTLH